MEKLPNPALIQPRIPQDIRHETECNVTELQSYIQETHHLLNQRAVADCVLESVRLDCGHLIGLDASGGTGKTFTLTYILTTVRADGKVALQQPQVELLQHYFQREPPFTAAPSAPLYSQRSPRVLSAKMTVQNNSSTCAPCWSLMRSP